MCKDKNMFALIIAIFISVIFITGWVFADHNVFDLITATPIFEMKNTASLHEIRPDLPVLNIQASDTGMCMINDGCQ